ADEEVHGGDPGAVVLEGPALGLAQQLNDVVGEELAIESEHRLRLAGVLVEQLLELAEQLRQIGPQAFAPIADAGVGRSQQAHEHMRTTETVPARLSRQTQRLAKHLEGALAQQIQSQPAGGLKDVFGAILGACHAAFLQIVTLSNDPDYAPIAA